jgi:N-formylglutamate deformylase
MKLQMLPIIQSIPHGGLEVPPEVRARLAIDETTIYNECDLWADDLYDFAHPDLIPLTTQNVTMAPLATITMPVARVLVDANRPPDNIDDPDGAIKSITSYGQQIYISPLTLPEREQFLDSYWLPFHRELDAAIHAHASETRLFLDCHNMAQYGPDAYGDPGQRRPLICLANFGDTKGEQKPNGHAVTCPGSLLRAARDLAQNLFEDLPLLQPDNRPAPIVLLNRPFAGGYILQTKTDLLSQVAERPIPGIMIEINRGLLVGPQTPLTPIAPPDLQRIAAIRSRLYHWVISLLDLC